MVKNTNYKVIFPGENPEYKDILIGAVKKYNLEDRIVFPGYINGREYLSITDLMVLPSIKDGVSFAFIESITMGVPVIRTNTGDYYEDIKDLCFWVDYGDTNNLSRLIEEFLDENEKFAKTALLAKKESYKFNIDTMVNEYYELYNSIIDNKG